jgi:hypothetical protein
MTAAIFGLAGVVVGGVLTGVVNWLLQRGQANSAAKAIARLTYDDFLHYQSTLVRGLAAQHWWSRGALLQPQVSLDDRKLLLGWLADDPSQEVAAAQGWMGYLINRREAAPQDQGPTPEDVRVMRDTFCRLEQAREQLSSVSGRRFGSFQDGAVLASLPTDHTLEDLQISGGHCTARRGAAYGREPDARQRR